MTKNVFNKLIVFPAMLIVIYLGIFVAAHASECTLIIDARTDATVKELGECDKRFVAASTFKIALALMGYDAGILVDAKTPLWSWQPGIPAPKRDQKDVDPASWQADSVLWYSRAITSRLGGERFSAYVDAFDYGNKNVSGEPGARNGLSHAWTTSLTISPREQTVFIRRLLALNLPVSSATHRQTMAIVPTFTTKSGWRVHGKTGSGWTRDVNGGFRRDRPDGWFVGWAERHDQLIVFARLGTGTVEGRQGLLEQKKMLTVLEKL